MSKGSKRREENSAKIAENWDIIFKSRWDIEQFLEEHKPVLIDKEIPCIRARLEARTKWEKATKIDYLSCPCSKCSPFTL